MKAAADFLATVLMLPPLCVWWVLDRTRAGSRDAVLQGFSQGLSLFPGRTGDYLRRPFYRAVLAAWGPGTTVSFGTIFATRAVRLGSHVYVGAHCNISHCAIGDDTMLGSNVIVLSGGRNHGIDRMDLPMRLQESRYEPVSIGRDVWVGNGAIILADIADHAVVGAGAVVTRPVPAAAIVVGNPARVLRYRDGRTGGEA